MRKPAAVIFDMDGLLLDTERIAVSTFIEACRECNYDPDLNVYYRCIGTTYVEAKKILTGGYGQSFPYDAVSMIWEKYYDRDTLEKPVPLKEGAVSLLNCLERKQTRMAVVTSTVQNQALKKLRNAGIMNYFQFILCGDQVSNGKPDPEIYLTACTMLSEDPANCLALEDSDNGVRSAFSAGLNVIQIPDLKEPAAEIKALHHPIVRSLLDVEALLSAI